MLVPFPSFLMAGSSCITTGVTGSWAPHQTLSSAQIALLSPAIFAPQGLLCDVFSLQFHVLTAGSHWPRLSHGPHLFRAGHSQCSCSLVSCFYPDVLAPGQALTLLPGHHMSPNCAPSSSSMDPHWHKHEGH
jgi:hypothetical protein